MLTQNVRKRTCGHLPMEVRFQIAFCSDSKWTAAFSLLDLDFDRH